MEQNSVKQAQQRIINDFSLLDRWEDRYEYIISIGKQMPPLEKKYRTDKNLINGCQSQVWLNASLKKNKVIFTADSDALITKGIIALLLSVFSDKTPDDILAADANFIDKIGLKAHLSPNRANGISSMLKQIKLLALVYRSNLAKH